MKLSRIQWVGGATAIAVSTAFASSCSSLASLPVAATTPTMPSLTASSWPISQVDFGHQAAFAKCRPPACPSVTRKTLAMEPRTAAAGSQPITTASSLAANEFLAPATADTHHTARNQVSTTAAQPELPLTRQLVVHFAFGDASLSATTRALIDEVAKPLASVRLIAISGRTDSVGPLSTNQRLATARANAVRDHLRSRFPHLAPAMTLEAQGACCFAASNRTPQGRAMNRRVEVVFERDAESQ